MTKKTRRRQTAIIKIPRNKRALMIGAAVILLMATVSLCRGHWNAASGSGAKLETLLNVAEPQGMKSELVRYTGFNISFNPSTHNPNYAAWVLTADETRGTHKRINNFRQDEMVYGSATPDDYRRSGYDRGHLVPAADQKWSKEAMEDCFYLTNICPQDKSLNSGAWNTLEELSRNWARRDSALVIIAGPIYNTATPRRIGKTGVAVPDAFFKVIAAPHLSRPRAIAYIFPNMKSPGKLEDYAMTVDQVEQITGLDFLHNLPDDTENFMESTYSIHQWQ